MRHAARAGGACAAFRASRVSRSKATRMLHLQGGKLSFRNLSNRFFIVSGAGRVGLCQPQIIGKDLWRKIVGASIRGAGLKQF